jgi:hypothetical protein
MLSAIRDDSSLLAKRMNLSMAIAACGWSSASLRWMVSCSYLDLVYGGHIESSRADFLEMLQTAGKGVNILVKSYE